MRIRFQSKRLSVATKYQGAELERCVNVLEENFSVFKIEQPGKPPVRWKPF